MFEKCLNGPLTSLLAFVAEQMGSPGASIHGRILAQRRRLDSGGTFKRARKQVEEGIQSRCQRNPSLVILRTLFKTLNIRQSSPLATVTNILTVALSPSFDLAYSDRAVITISGILNGVTPDDSIAMSGNGSKIFSDGNTTGRLEYGDEDNLVRLHLAPNQTMLSFMARQQPHAKASTLRCCTPE